MNETHDPEDELDQMLDRTVDDVAKAIKEREIPKYDGVQGEPPEWVPEWAVLYFEGYRDRLLSDRGFEVSALLKLIEQYRKEYFREEYTDGVLFPYFRYFRCPKTYPNGQSVDPHCFHDEIGFLTWIRWCVGQGKEKGLEILGGGFAVSGVKFSSGGSPKKGKEYEPKKSIRKICEFIGSSKFDDVLDKLRDAEFCMNRYESTRDPIGVLFTGVYDGTETISYLKRGALPNRQKQIGFKRLKDILDELKK